MSYCNYHLVYIDFAHLNYAFENIYTKILLKNSALIIYLCINRLVNQSFNRSMYLFAY